ncbi:helix-turn-helix domain-containing protein [Acinetobacter venetianus]|uniref:helix-turn-helix domain-containing protein n=1 Tax=Acinetobacter venetianus TaxID=52133 RepID=UPI00036E0237|nr:helix-turn-helix transcriptional regulator [Acinetobacter venetianus]
MLIFQQWLVLQRQQQELTQEALANRLGKPMAFIRDVESGLYKLDVIEYLHYCKALEINPNIGLEFIDSNL